MEKVKGVAKSGWHPPGKDGKKESWRGDFKGINQVAGWVGKGKSSGSSSSQTHQSRPLTALKDPSSFGPPPKKTSNAGGLATSDSVANDMSGPGETEYSAERQSFRDIATESEDTTQQSRKPSPPRVPFRADRTGLTTNNLPKPPVRRSGYDHAASPTSIPAIQKSKPSLPPRLPPRQNSGTSNDAPLSPMSKAHPPQYQNPAPDYPNNAALTRLGAAGVNVPGFGIGKRPERDEQQEQIQSDYPNNAALSRIGATGVPVPALGIGGHPEAPNPWQDEQSPAPNTASSSAPEAPKLSELQSRFSRMSTSSTSPTSPSQGTTLAQKQAAFKTASSFRNDPSSVSLSDAKSAASTANNFRERHGEQAAAGWQTASGLNKKYGISNKIGSYNAEPNVWADQSTSSPPMTSPSASESHNFNGKKAPPPPPPKKPLVAGSSSSSPPVPLASKPTR